MFIHFKKKIKVWTSLDRQKLVWKLVVWPETSPAPSLGQFSNDHILVNSWQMNLFLVVLESLLGWAWAYAFWFPFTAYLSAHFDLPSCQFGSLFCCYISSSWACWLFILVESACSWCCYCSLLLLCAFFVVIVATEFGQVFSLIQAHLNLWQLNTKKKREENKKILKSKCLILILSKLFEFCDIIVCWI